MNKYELMALRQLMMSKEPEDAGKALSLVEYAIYRLHHEKDFVIVPVPPEGAKLDFKILLPNSEEWKV